MDTTYGGSCTVLHSVLLWVIAHKVLMFTFPLPFSLGSANTWQMYHEKKNSAFQYLQHWKCTDHLNFRPTGLSAQLMHVTAVT